MFRLYSDRTMTRLETPAIIALAVSLATTALIPATTWAADAKPPNIVFILADDLGQRDLGSYGSTFYETPNLDRLARDGAKFTDAYAACPVCSPTRSTIMTGQYPARTRNTDYFGAPNGFPDGIPAGYEPRRDGRFKLSWVDHGQRPLWPAPYLERLAADHTTLAEALRAAGYATMHAGKWHLGPEGSWPEDHGFDVNRGGHDRGGPYGGKKYFSPFGNPRLEDGPEGEHLADRLAEECAQFIGANRDRPFFVSLWFYDVHTPLMAKPELVKKYEAKRDRLGLKPAFGREPPREVRLVQEHAVYAAMVETMDTAVGRVLARLDELGLRDVTLVIFMSDNGGLSTSEGSPTSNLPLRAGKGWLYEGGIRVPLLVRWPGVLEPGRVIHTPVISTDFFPTLLEASGLPARPDQHRDGISFVPALRGKQFNPDRALFWHYPHYGNQGGTPAAAIRRGDWKLIQFFEDDRVELFNLRRDLGEQDNLAAAHPRRVRDLRRQLHAWQGETDALRPIMNPKPSTPTP